MASGAAYIKSLLWLTALGGLGFGLLELTRPSEEKLARIREYSKSTSLSDDEKRKILFMQRLKEAAAGDPPIYTKNENDNK